MPELIVKFFGQWAKVNCDGRCSKAWGINNRPKVHLSEDEDDYAFLADDELGDAPVDPGTYEGGQGKPRSVGEFPNKWCIRECERCNISLRGMSDQQLPVRTFDARVFNKAAEGER